MARSEPIRVAHVATTLNVGGAEQLLLDLCRLMPRHGIEASVTYLKGPGPLAGEFRALGIDVAKVGILAPADPTAVARLAARLRALEPHVVHTHMFKADLHGALAAILAGKPRLVTTKHAAEEARAWAPVAALDRLLAARADAVVAVSDDMADFTARVERIPRNGIRVIYSGIDLSRMKARRPRADVRTELDIPDGARVILCTARLHPSKGHDVLIEAMARLQDRPDRSSTHLLIAGDGQERARLERLAERHRARVRFLGARRDVPDLLAAADCFVLPSIREGLGLALVEAMAAGLPCVATTAGAIPQVLRDGVDGLLVSPGDAASLADALSTVLLDPGLAERLGHAARRRAEERFDVRRTAEEYAALYREVLAPAT